MPCISRETAQTEDYGPVIDRHATIGDQYVTFTTFRVDMDATPLLKGLPDDRCQCPHWGYVFSGEVTFRYADHEETYRAGDAFWTPPGHAPVHNAPDTEVLMISPSEPMAQTEAVILANFRAMGAPTPAG